MMGYRKDLASVLLVLMLALICIFILVWVRDLRILWLVAIFSYFAFFELTDKVIIDDRGVSTSKKIGK